VSGRVAAIYEVFRAAAGTDADVRALWDELRAERRGGAANFVRFITDLGPLRDGLDPRSAADIVWILNDPGLYHQLVLQQHWSPSKFCSWAAETMLAQLLRPAARRRRH
jgi:hypothetical protein